MAKLCCNFLNFVLISNDLTEMVNFPTQIPDCDSYNPALSYFFLSSDASICSTIAFSLLRDSDYVAVLDSIDFQSNSKRDAQFHRISYEYSHADWNRLRYCLSNVPWEDIFELGASAAASEFWDWFQVKINA